MKLKEILEPGNLRADLRSSSREEVLSELVEAIAAQVPVDRAELVKVLAERETQSPTAMSGGVAVPHARLPELKRFILAVGRSRAGIDFGAEDGPTRIFFLLMSPTDDTVSHLKILARIARLCRRPAFKQGIQDAAGAEEIYQIIMREDAAN